MMLTVKDVVIIYETLLSSPGMNDMVKIDVRFSRKNILLLTRVIHAGLTIKDQLPKGDLMHTITTDIEGEIRETSNEMLRKAGLTDLHEKLNLLQHE